MIELRNTAPGYTQTQMRDAERFGTAHLPDHVVNQRVVATVWMSSRPDRTARWGVGVWMDKQQSDDAAPFQLHEEEWRGMDGVGLTPSEAQYVAACLYSAAERVLNAGLRE